jgi:signal transduction histidine kinase
MLAGAGRGPVIHSIVDNVTHRAAPRRKSRSRLEGLATTNRRTDEILALLGHELRGRLASITAGVRLLRTQTGESTVPQKAQVLVERQVHRMTQLVDDLLDLSRISRGSMQLQRERRDLRVILKNAIDSVESDIYGKRHRLSTSTPDLPVWLRADSRRLEQVFVNLLDNAAKYTDVGGDLAVWLHTCDGQAVVRIRDSGIGIAPDALPYVFDLFRQVNDEDSRFESGLGLGLALVRDFVELHDGIVTAASAGFHQGSEFTVRLPLEV